MACINLLLLLILSAMVVFIEHTNAQDKPPLPSLPTPTVTPAIHSINRVTADGEKRTLTIIYEALCPDSERFMYQLGPVYEALKDYLQLEFIPYGLTKLLCRKFINGKCEHPNFTCKHGPSGCRANRLHSCALQYSESQEKQVNFIMCTMGPYKTAAEKCLALLGYSAYDVDTCMTFDEGTELQLKAFAKTRIYKPKKLPIVIFDQTFSQEIQDAAINDFRILACSLLANKYQFFNHLTAPGLCQTSEIFPDFAA